MSLNLNQVIISGNLTRDPEIRQLAEGKMVTNFSIANNRKWKGNDGTQHEEVNFIDCEAWARTAEMVGQYLTKGSGCVVLGRLKLESWTDKEGGKRSKMKVVVESVQFVGSRPKGDEGMDEASDAAPTATPSDTKRAQPSVTKSSGSPLRQAAVRAGTATLDEPPF